MRRYIVRTQKSKDYTAQHRPHLADLRVVNVSSGRSLLEIIYQIVIERRRARRCGPRQGNERDHAQRLRHEPVRPSSTDPGSSREAPARRRSAKSVRSTRSPATSRRKSAAMTTLHRAGLCNTAQEAAQLGLLRIARKHAPGRTKIVDVYGVAYHGDLQRGDRPRHQEAAVTCRPRRCQCRTRPRTCSCSNYGTRRSRSRSCARTL